MQVYWLLNAIAQDHPKLKGAAELRDSCEQAALEGYWVRRLQGVWQAHAAGPALPACSGLQAALPSSWHRGPTAGGSPAQTYLLRAWAAVPWLGLRSVFHQSRLDDFVVRLALDMAHTPMPVPLSSSGGPCLTAPPVPQTAAAPPPPAVPCLQPVLPGGHAHGRALQDMGCHSTLSLNNLQSRQPDRLEVSKGRLQQRKQYEKEYTE